MNVKELFILSIFIISSLVLAFYRFDFPLADWHSWRQVDTSSVSREFLANGFDILHPTYHDLSNVPSGQDNPKGYRFVEFPIFNVLQAGFYSIFKVFSLEQWGRIVSIFASILSTVFLYLIVRRHANGIVALGTAFFFSFLPFNVFYSRTVLPDPSMVAATLAGIYFFDLWISSYVILKSKTEESVRSFTVFRMTLFFVLSVLFTAAAFLLKPYALFFVLPIVYLAFIRFGYKMVLKWQLWVFAILTLAPLVWWRMWMMQFPEGIPVSNWLFNEGNIRFKGSFFYWIFADRIGRLILGYFGIGILVCGFIGKIPKKDYGFFLSFIASSLVYLFVMARGNVQHDYYQILIIPSLCIFLGLGVWFLTQASTHIVRPASFAVLFVCTAFCLGFGWYFVRDYYNINNPSLTVAGEAVDALTPKNAKVIALYDGDTTFLYQTKRKGWASFQDSLPILIDKGADYLVLINPTQKDLDGFGKEYPIVGATSEYLLIKLH